MQRCEVTRDTFWPTTPLVMELFRRVVVFSYISNTYEPFRFTLLAPKSWTDPTRPGVHTPNDRWCGHIRLAEWSCWRYSIDCDKPMTTMAGVNTATALFTLSLSHIVKQNWNEFSFSSRCATGFRCRRVQIQDALKTPRTGLYTYEIS